MTLAKEIPDLDFKDTGCEISPRCLECPRQKCILDEPGLGPGRMRLARRNEEILARHRNGDSLLTIGIAMGISSRQVERIIRAAGVGVN